VRYAKVIPAVESRAVSVRTAIRERFVVEYFFIEYSFVPSGWSPYVQEGMRV
jgi:hypothetical protein